MLTAITLDVAEVKAYLGKPRFFAEVAQRTQMPGVATGLAWTPVGGDIMFIEATLMPGSRGFQLTGQLGDVMRESAQAALSYVRARAERWASDRRTFFEHAISTCMCRPARSPRTARSAGVTMATALTVADLRAGRCGRTWP